MIENLLSVAPPRANPSFYRTTTGAEIDLVVERPGGRELWAIEVKRSFSGSLGKGFHQAREILKPTRSFVVTSSEGRYPVAEGVEAIGLREMAELVARGR